MAKEVKLLYFRNVYPADTSHHVVKVLKKINNYNNLEMIDFPEIEKSVAEYLNVGYKIIGFSEDHGNFSVLLER